MKREICENCPVGHCRIYYCLNKFNPLSNDKFEFLHVYIQDDKNLVRLRRSDELHDCYVCDGNVEKIDEKLFLRKVAYEGVMLENFEWEFDDYLPENVTSEEECPCLMEHKMALWNEK